MVMDPERAAEVEELVEAVRDYLREHREVRARARGRRPEIDRALGRKVGYCATLLRESPPPDQRGTKLVLPEMFALLLELGIDPRRVMSGFWGFDLELYLLKLKEQGQRQVDWLKKRRGKAKPLKASLEELAANAEEMEQLRLSNPRAGKKKGFAALATLDQLEESEERARVECETWGALAGLQRMTATFSSGAACLLYGLRVARRWGLVECEAKLLRRCCYLIGDQGDYEKAIKCAERSAALYAKEADLAGIGRAMLDRGIMLDKMGDYKCAVEFYKKSLAMLGDEGGALKLSVYQCIAIAYLQLDDRRRCHDLVEKMRGMFSNLEPEQEAAILWLEGELALKERDYSMAEDKLQESRSIYVRGDNGLNEALVCIRLAKALLLGGKQGHLQEIAPQMLALPSKLRHNKLVRASFDEFLCLVVSGELTVPLADFVYEALRRGAPRRAGAPRLL